MSNDTILKGLDIVVKEADDKERIITAIGSKQIVDRDGDILMIKGVNTANFKKNPIVLLNHDYYDFPIGKAVGRKVWVDDDRLMFKIQFATDEENPKAGTAYKLFKGGYLNAFSLSFVPNYEKTEYPENHAKGARRIFHEAELLEISVVSVPANQEALRAGINKAWDDGTLDGEELADWEEMLDKMPKEETMGYDLKAILEEKLKNMNVEQKDDWIRQADEVLDRAAEAKEDLTKALREAECKIAELTLQLQEKDMEQEIDDWDSYLQGLFSESDNQGASTDEGANGSQTDELTYEEALRILEENDKNG